MAAALSDIDRRIVGALQVDGRASWTLIAKALGEPLRTVARRGKELVESGAVSVVGLPNLGPTCVIEIACSPSRLESLARELAEHPGVVYVLVLSNPSSLLVEVHEQAFDLATMTLRVIPSFAGVRDVSATPVLRYYKTNAGWRPGLLAPAEVDALGARPPVEESIADPEALDDADAAIVAALERDGRTGVAELANAAGVTEPTARRRLADLQARGAVTMRALVDPAALGFRVEASLRLTCPPGAADALGTALAAVPEVRYVAHVLGAHAIVAHLNARDLPHVRSLLSGPWISHVETLHASLVTAVLKRSGRIARSD